MSERNTISGITAAVMSSFVDSWEVLLTWLVVALVLIVVDLRFGIEAAVKRGEKIRSSRAIRRTVNKLIDYLCWISVAWVLGGSFGKVFEIPMLAAIIMLVVCTVELSSIFDNYFEVKGLNKRFNVWKFFGKIFRIDGLGDAVEEKENGDFKGG